MDFDRLLARELRRIALGLSIGALGSCGPSDETLEAGCDGGDLPEGYLVAEGVRYVDPGAACPPHPAKAWPVDCCPFMEPQVICRFVDRIENQVVIRTGTGTYLVAADEAQTAVETMFTGTGVSTSDPVDVCVYDGVFQTDGICCGRPLLDHGEPLVAAVREGASDWVDPETPFGGLTADERGRVADHWLEVARLEHASVASFARFTLDLMALGAPPELLVAAQQAAIDEIDHAHRCFALAGRALGRAIGPGPMALPAWGPVDRPAFAEALVREGCVGETLAALDAAARLVGATEPAVRDSLATIRSDEAEHASLAWRTLSWLLSEDDGAIRERVDRVLAQEEARWTAPVTSRPATDAEHAYGLFDPALRRAWFAAGFERVIRPGFAGLPTPAVKG